MPRVSGKKSAVAAKPELVASSQRKVCNASNAGYFTTLSELADPVPQNRSHPMGAEKLKVLSYPKLLIIDEVGYILLSSIAAYFAFALVCRRYEKRTMIWISNKGFTDWASVFAGDEVITTAILDRLLHHGTVVNIRGRSYRLKDKLQAGSFTFPTPQPACPYYGDTND